MIIDSILTTLSQPETIAMFNKSMDMFFTLFFELTFLFIAISFLVAIINQKLPAEKIQSLLGAKKGRGYITAAGLGAITPFCSCSTIPMLIGLLKANAGFGPVMTFLFTSPLLNPIVIALFIPVLGIQATILYASMAISVSLLAGYFLHKFKFDQFIKQDMLQPASSCCSSNSCCDTESTSCCSDTVAVQQPSIWFNAWLESWSLFKSMFPYMLIAMIIGAGVHGFIPENFFSEVASADNQAAIPAAALIGIPLYIRVTTLLPLVASFLAKGVSIGAVMALVIGSGGASLPEVILLKKLFRWPLLLAFLSVIFGMAILVGFSFNLLFT